MKWDAKTEADLKEIAEKLVTEIDAPVILFKGEMGTGKTTFIKAICAALNVEDYITSPTFSIINEYHSPQKSNIYHFDFYRLETEEEAYDFGYEDYFFSGQICLVEWPEKIRNLIPPKFGLVTIKEHDGKRNIEFTPSATALP